MGNPACPDLQVFAGHGLLGSAIGCAIFAQAWSPRGRGDIFSAALEVVSPLAGGRCVPRTGVHLDCPLRVGRTSVAWEETVEGAATP